MSSRTGRRAHWLQHVPFEGLGSIAEWLAARRYEVGCSRLYAGDPLPDPANLDLLVVMGGPMSVNDTDRHPWLDAEVACIDQAIRDGVPVLGICLGAQLITRAGGGRVARGAQPEIGWWPIEGIGPEAAGLGMPASFEAFHWHGEVCEPPPAARLLARSPACAVQAFAIDRHVLGLQFHLETTPAAARALIDHCADELSDAPSIQTAASMLQVGPERYEALRVRMATVLDHLHACHT